MQAPHDDESKFKQAPVSSKHLVQSSRFKQALGEVLNV